MQRDLQDRDIEYEEVPSVQHFSDCQMYNPVTNEIFLVGRLNHIRNTPPFAIKLPNGTVLAAGGRSLSSAEIFDPVTRTWTLTNSMNAGRSWHGIIMLNDNKILITGGSNGGGHLKSVEIYKP